jgi:hypothetical protein
MLLVEGLYLVATMTTSLGLHYWLEQKILHQFLLFYKAGLYKVHA